MQTSIAGNEEFRTDSDKDNLPPTHVVGLNLPVYVDAKGRPDRLAPPPARTVGILTLSLYPLWTSATLCLHPECNGADEWAMQTSSSRCRPCRYTNRRIRSSSVPVQHSAECNTPHR